MLLQAHSRMQSTTTLLLILLFVFVSSVVSRGGFGGHGHFLVGGLLYFLMSRCKTLFLNKDISITLRSSYHHNHHRSSSTNDNFSFAPYLLLLIFAYRMLIR
ncbi:hypothetical protein PRIPAC_88293 [Pristionchus pacificus]|uniref:Uncharacterized protein n=1 Tax=Pristionchus pacificus TaxID=54126 RepID=A0A2A6B7Y1_PRIPA|nr:hypothetical protein PRIPAC_88293 [Pristionchus pacificus]|eukprot:PDM61986.1 hypothetical protein PRIPAC_51428 [Pristionchus pacificus]